MQFEVQITITSSIFRVQFIAGRNSFTKRTDTEGVWRTATGHLGRQHGHWRLRDWGWFEKDWLELYSHDDRGVSGAIFTSPADVLLTLHDVTMYPILDTSDSGKCSTYVVPGGLLPDHTFGEWKVVSPPSDPKLPPVDPKFRGSGWARI